MCVCLFVWCVVKTHNLSNFLFILLGTYFLPGFRRVLVIAIRRSVLFCLQTGRRNSDGDQTSHLCLAAAADFFYLTPNLSIFLSRIFDNVSDGFYNSKVNFPRSPNRTRDGNGGQTSRLCFPTAPLRKDEAWPGFGLRGADPRRVHRPGPTPPPPPSSRMQIFEPPRFLLNEKEMTNPPPNVRFFLPPDLYALPSKKEGGRAPGSHSDIVVF